MSHEVDWTKRITTVFIEEALLNEEEITVLMDKIKGKSRVETAMKLNVSVSKVDSIIRDLKDKYDRVQAYCPELPRRKVNRNEEEM